jgi:hypothetical protein
MIPVMSVVGKVTPRDQVQNYDRGVSLTMTDGTRLSVLVIGKADTWCRTLETLYPKP